MSDYCTTPEERRKVAAKLREYPIALLIALQKTVKSKALAELGELMRIAGVDQGNPEELFIRLADLIDHTCRIYYTDTSINTPDTGYEPDGYYSCSCCGELDDYFAEMWDTYQARGYEGEPPFRYCPYCGSRVVIEDE